MSDTLIFEQNWEELRAALAKRGVIFNILIPFVFLGAGYTLRRMGVFSENTILDESTHQLLLYILGALALGELVIAYFLKRSLLSPERLGTAQMTFAEFSARCVAGMTIVFMVGAAPAMYGFVVYALGATIEQFVFFVLVSLVGYRFLRPGKDELERLWNTAAGEIIQ